ncbi:MAG: DNA cytosine methyltransferase [Alphaproteobacteria bacterium]|nr:DNA cytosine methyltransferase [Alphaproteobacteria bacterium]
MNKMAAILEDIHQPLKQKPTCLDLFSGAGGLSVGFAIAGGQPLGAVDFDSDSIKTYQSIFPYADDVACANISNWKPKSRKGDVDVIIGGPPCQGFSLARGLRFVDDPRNHLYKHFVEIVKFYQPKWFVLENVEGITNIGQGIILRQILEDFASIGYKVDYKVVNMAEFGVPQLRKRAILVGNRCGIDFVWPEAFCYDPRKKIAPCDKAHAYNSVNDALGDIVLPQGNFFAHRANSQMRGPRNRNAHTEPAFTLRVRGDEFALCEEPAQSAFVPGPVPLEDIAFRAPQNELQELLRNCHPAWLDAPKTSTSRQKKVTLKGTRRLTIREQARLQTFPDWINFYGKTTSQARQIGNAVPPLFALQLFRQIFSYL